MLMEKIYFAEIWSVMSLFHMGYCFWKQELDSNLWGFSLELECTRFRDMLA